MHASPFLSLVLTLSLAPVVAAGDPPTVAGNATAVTSAAPVDPPLLRTYSLNHLSPNEAVRIMSLMHRASPNLRVTTVGANNAILVFGPGAIQAEIETLLQKLDVKANTSADLPVTAVEICPLRSTGIETESLERILKFIVKDYIKGASVMVDHQENLLIIRGRPETNEEVRQLLLMMMKVSTNGHGVAPDPGFQFRVTWLVSGQAQENAARIPENLREAVTECEKLGVEKPRLAAQVLLHVAPGAKFEANGLAKLNMPCAMTIAGSIFDRTAKTTGVFSDNYSNLVDITITAGPETGRTPTRRSILHTRVEVSPGHPLVLGIIPADGMTSAFVVEVTRPVVGQAAEHVSEKRFTFEMRNATWIQVCDWLRDASGLPVVGGSYTGTFTFTPPSPKMTYTIPEITDIINEALAAEGRLLIRRKSSFTFVASDRKIEGDLLPRLSPGDLADHGSTELAQLLLPLKSVKAEDMVPEVKKLLTSFGEVVAMKPNSLIIQDKVGTLRRIVAILGELEATKSK